MANPIDHFYTLLDEQRWAEARDCLDAHRTEIARLGPRQKSDLLRLMYGRKGQNTRWQCDLVLLDQMCQLGAPVSTISMTESFGVRLFEMVRVNGQGELRDEDDTDTELKTRALERLSAQMDQAGVILPLTLDVIPLTDEIFNDFEFQTGPRILTPVRMQLLEFIIRVFSIEFTRNIQHRVYLTHLLVYGERVDDIQFLEREGLIDWTVPIYPGHPSREQWITTQIEENPGDDRIQSIYRLMHARRLAALAGNPRLGVLGRRPLPGDVLQIVGHMLTGRPPQ